MLAYLLTSEEEKVVEQFVLILSVYFLCIILSYVMFFAFSVLHTKSKLFLRHKRKKNLVKILPEMLKGLYLVQNRATEL